MWESVRCVVYNTTYEPLSIVPAKKAILLFFEGKATILEKHATYEVHSISRAWPVPIQLKMNSWVSARSTYRIPAALSPQNIKTRDSYTCQYCGRHKSQLKSREILTIDHVIPKQVGGKHVWENVVTACSTCNHKKDNKSLTQSGMKLTIKPYRPTVFEIWSKSESRFIHRA